MSQRSLPTDAADPEPCDFDAELEQLPAGSVNAHDGDPSARLALQLTFDGDDADALRRIARERGQRPSEVVSDLLRTA